MARRTTQNEDRLIEIHRKHYSELTGSDYAVLRENGIINGCGGKGQWTLNAILKWCLKRLRYVFIEADCDIHDFTYWQWGDDARRLECDEGFFRVIMQDIVHTDLGIWNTLRFTFIALTFYYAVRIKGRDFFVYR